MRRRAQSGERWPPRLATFDPSDWPGGSWGDRFGLWREARRVWADAHGWPVSPLELMRGEVEVLAARRGEVDPRAAVDRRGGPV